MLASLTAPDPMADTGANPTWIEAFRQRLDAPSPAFPSTRCISATTWAKLFRDIAEREERDGRKVPGPKAALDTLIELGIISRIAFDPPSGSSTAPHLYTIDFRPNAAERVDPIELLVALAPEDGVLCYGTALRYFGLTTQLLPHHVALPRPDRKPTGPRPTPSLHADFSKIGTARGVYQGIPYYITQRSTRWLIHHPSRMLDDRTIFRMTSRGQTMVDTLLRPTYCGGAAVVFEAWEQIRGTLDADELANLLAQINDGALTRRVGWMFENVVGHVPATIGELADRAREIAIAEGAVAPLLPGCPFRAIDPEWQLAVP
jgi:predicted transcriptional regulator of viral defense system